VDLGERLVRLGLDAQYSAVKGFGWTVARVEETGRIAPEDHVGLLDRAPRARLSGVIDRVMRADVKTGKIGEQDVKGFP
jgi:hypothetical protein